MNVPYLFQLIPNLIQYTRKYEKMFERPSVYCNESIFHQLDSSNQSHSLRLLPSSYNNSKPFWPWLIGHTRWWHTLEIESWKRSRCKISHLPARKRAKPLDDAFLFVASTPILSGRARGGRRILLINTGRGGNPRSLLDIL